MARTVGARLGGVVVTADVRAPAGAVGWVPAVGFVYTVEELPTHIEDGHYALIVSERDGMVRISGTETAPLVSVLRLDAAVEELTSALNDVAEHFAGRLAGRGDPS